MKARVRCDEGANLSEYMLLVVLIAIVALLALAFAGDEVSELWSQTGSSLEGAGAPGPAPQQVVAPTNTPGFCRNGGLPPGLSGTGKAPPPAVNCPGS